MTLSETYERWLLERVLLDGWSTLKCAKLLSNPIKNRHVDPDQVRKDFEEALAKVPLKHGD